MGQSLPKPALRPFLPADTPLLAAIFVAADEDYGTAYDGLVIELNRAAAAPAAPARGGRGGAARPAH